MTLRRLGAVRYRFLCNALVFFVLAITTTQASAITCPSTLPRPQLSACQAKQRACQAACRAGSGYAACAKGCRQDFELIPGEYIVEVRPVDVREGASSGSGARPAASPSPVPTYTAAPLPGSANFLAQQEEGRNRLLNALMSIGIGTSETDTTPKVVEIRGFDTTPWVFIVGILSEESARDLARLPGIVSVSPMVKPQLVVESGGDVTSLSGGNVTIHPMQIYLENSGAARVHEPNGVSYIARADLDIDVLSGWATESRLGEGVVIAVIDDGFDLANQNLAANLAVNPGEIDCNGIDDDGNGYIDDRMGWNASSKSGCSSEMNGDSGHGTHVAGLAAATARSSSERLSGAAPFSKFLPVKASEQETLENGMVISTFSSESLIEAYRFVLARIRRGENIKVLNLSLAVSCDAVTAVETSLLNELAAAGVSIVVAAGNAGSNTDATRFCPASLPVPGLVSVANVAPSGLLHLTSNFGRRAITTSAPGTVVFGVNGKLLTGTSMAAPLVSGVVALMYSAQPLLSPSDVQDILLQATKRVGNASLPVRSGGLVSAPLAIKYAREWKVFGTVKDARTGNPLQDVLVRMSSPSTGSVGVTTDAKGRFALSRPRNGEAVNLFFSKQGYVFSGTTPHPNSVAQNADRGVIEFSVVGSVASGQGPPSDRRRYEVQ